MKACFIVGTLERGGAERQLIFMLRALKSFGMDLTVLCLTKGEAWEPVIKSMGISVEWVGKSKSRALKQLTIINRLRKQRVDVIQSSHFYTNIYAGIAGRALGIPNIGAVRSDLSSEMAIHGKLGRWQVSLPDFLIVNSELAFQRAREYGISPDNVALIPNVVEIKEAEITPSEKKSVNVLFVGRLDKNKRPDRFIGLASTLSKKMPDTNIRFRIAGDGVLKESLTQMANQLGLPSEMLKFLGDRSDMSSIYRGSDLLVSTSVREGTSNVILEAMAHGLPVIATNVGGTPQIVNSNTGILVDPDNDEQLEEAATKLILDRNLRTSLGENGRKFVEQFHSIEMLAHSLTEIYVRLIERRRTKR